MVCAGIDGGSRAVKIALVDAASGQLVASATADQDLDYKACAGRLLDSLLISKGLRPGDIARTVATGYARNRIPAEATVTEITCHAAGVHHLCPDALTIIEIGGQDSKLIRLDRNGSVRDFAMNDRCAAGTGRFLEQVATRFRTSMEELGHLAISSATPTIISSTCVVFAETEIIGLLASGVAPSDIAAGVQQAMSLRVAAMTGRNVSAPVVFTGGVALVPGMRQALEKTLETSVSVAPTPQVTGAIGAALLARKQLLGDAKIRPSA
jgi:predicted CoA-substrate-specific enzyme activase